MILVLWWECVCVCCPMVVGGDAGVCAGWTSSECSCRYSSMTSRSTSGQEEGATPPQAPRSPLSLISVTYAIWQTQSRTAMIHIVFFVFFFYLREFVEWRWWRKNTLHDGWHLSVASHSLRCCYYQTAHLLFFFFMKTHRCFVVVHYCAVVHHTVNNFALRSEGQGPDHQI